MLIITIYIYMKKDYLGIFTGTSLDFEKVDRELRGERQEEIDA